jgi:uncharacterized membrane protein
MNLVPFPIYNYINIALSFLFVVSTIIFKNENLQILINVIPIILIGLSSYCIYKNFNLTNNLKKSIVIGSFVGSIIIAFAPYILQFNTNKQLLFCSLAFTILLLINIFLVNLISNEK